MDFDIVIEYADVPQAYLQAGTDYQIHLQLPEELGIDTNKYIDRRLKSLYGLKQSGYLWHEEIDATMIALGLQRSKSDPCLYYVWDDGKLTICGLYVDDLLVLSQCNKRKAQITTTLKSKYGVPDLEYAKRCLGINMHKVSGGGITWNRKILSKSSW